MKRILIAAAVVAALAVAVFAWNSVDVIGALRRMHGLE